MKSITDIEWNLSCRTVLGMIVAMSYVGDVVIPCLTMHVVVHAKQLYYQAIYDFCLSICLRMEGCRQRKSCVELLPEGFPKGAENIVSLSKIIVIERP